MKKGNTVNKVLVSDENVIATIGCTPFPFAPWLAVVLSPFQSILPLLFTSAHPASTSCRGGQQNCASPPCRLGFNYFIRSHGIPQSRNFTPIEEPRSLATSYSRAIVGADAIPSVPLIDEQRCERP